MEQGECQCPKCDQRPIEMKNAVFKAITASKKTTPEWARIINGFRSGLEHEFALKLEPHRLDPGVDTGRIEGQESPGIEEEATLTHHRIDLEPLIGVDQLTQNGVHRHDMGKISPEQDEIGPLPDLK